MKLGFLTVCLGDIPLKEKAKWAKENGFEALEIACWPRSNTRDYASSDIDVASLTQEKADEIKQYFNEFGLIISSLAYYDNNLDKDHSQRVFVNNHVKKVIDAAAMLGTEYVGTFVGRNVDKSINENFIEFEKIFSELVSYAETKNVKLMIENCDMTGWLRPGEPGTISYSPELWHEMFKRVSNKNFGLNFDPSHLVLMLMDYLSPIDEFKERIFHVHAKDGRIRKDKLSRYGVHNKQLDTKNGSGYKEAKMPGLGDVDWKAFIESLKNIGYDFIVSIEHEDDEYAGTIEKVKEGLLIAKRELKKYI